MITIVFAISHNVRVYAMFRTSLLNINNARSMGRGATSRIIAVPIFPPHPKSTLRVSGSCRAALLRILPRRITYNPTISLQDADNVVVDLCHVSRRNQHRGYHHRMVATHSFLSFSFFSFSFSLTSLPLPHALNHGLHRYRYKQRHLPRRVERH
jgi:hypothetical protein